jgi:K+-transporting ATPase ATPase C chain
MVLRQLFRAIVVSAIFLVLLGLAYPAVETGIGQALFSHTANGSLDSYGSTLIGQTFKGPQWFQGRPEPADNNPMASGGSNLGPRSKVLVKDVRQQVALLRKEGISPRSSLVTTSGSGLDPDITPADAYDEAPAVARANRLPLATVRHLVATHVTGRELGFLGSPYVDVLQLNEALAKVAGRARR